MEKDSSPKKGLLSRIVAHGNNVLTRDTEESARSSSIESGTAARVAVNRRQYLKAGIAGVALSPLAGVAAGSTERHGVQFDRVAHAVDDLEMDPTGNEPIDDALQQSVARGNELVEFPEGEYLLSGDITADSVDNWGIIGQGERPEDVRFLNTSGASISISVEGGQGQLIENVTMDYSAQREGTMGVILKGTDLLYAVDVRFEGYNPISSQGDSNNLSLQVLDPDGTAIAEGVVREGPSAIASHASQGPPSNAPVSWLGPDHRGTLTYRDCHFENAGANVIYASRTNGTVQVEGCTFRNNNQSSVRISGADSYVRDCEFVVDTANAHPDNEYAEGGYINPHAMMWESGTEGRAGATIENCEIVYRSRPANDRPLQAVRGLGSIGAFTVRNTRFLLDTADTTAIYAQDPENPSFGTTASSPWNVTIDSVNIRSSGDSVDGAIELHNRPESHITGSELTLTGNQDGIVISNSTGCRIEDTHLDVLGEETVFSNANVDVSGYE